MRAETLIALLLAYCAYYFPETRTAYASRPAIASWAAPFLAWALLLVSGQFEGLWAQRFLSVDRYLAPLPQMMIGMAMVVVLYEQERRTVQENSLFFSTLDVDNSRLVSASDVTSGFEKILRRIMSLVRVHRAAIFVGDEWRSVLPNVAVGFSHEFAHDLHAQGLSEYLINMAYRRGGVVTLRNLPHLSEPLPPGPPGLFDKLKDYCTAYGIRSLTAVSLQTRERKFGVILLPQPRCALARTITRPPAAGNLDADRAHARKPCFDAGDAAPHARI